MYFLLFFLGLLLSNDNLYAWGWGNSGSKVSANHSVKSTCPHYEHLQKQQLHLQQQFIREMHDRVDESLQQYLQIGSLEQALPLVHIPQELPPDSLLRLKLESINQKHNNIYLCIEQTHEHFLYTIYSLYNRYMHEHNDLAHMHCACEHCKKAHMQALQEGVLAQFFQSIKNVAENPKSWKSNFLILELQRFLPQDHPVKMQIQQYKEEVAQIMRQEQEIYHSPDLLDKFQSWIQKYTGTLEDPFAEK